MAQHTRRFGGRACVDRTANGRTCRAHAPPPSTHGAQAALACLAGQVTPPIQAHKYESYALLKLCSVSGEMNIRESRVLGMRSMRVMFAWQLQARRRAAGAGAGAQAGVQEAGVSNSKVAALCRLPAPWNTQVPQAHNIRTHIQQVVHTVCTLHAHMQSPCTHACDAWHCTALLNRCTVHPLLHVSCAKTLCTPHATLVACNGLD